MVRYYFDIHDDGKWCRDELGIDLANFDEAKQQAISILPDIASDAVWSHDHHAIRCRVRDEANDVIYEGELIFDGHRVKDGL